MTNDSEKTTQRMRQANPVPDPTSLHADPHDAAALFASITQRQDLAAHSMKEKAMKSRDRMSPPLYRRPLAVAIGAGMAVIALIVPIALMSRTEPGVVAGPVTTVPETVPAATGVPPPVEAVMPTELAMTWDRAPLDAVFEGAWMRSVTVGGPGLVAVGSTEQGTAVVWTSEDGIVWQRIEDPSFEAPDVVKERYGRERFMSDVAAGPEGLVAIGGDHSWVEGNDMIEPVVWHSSDGVIWNETIDDVFDSAVVDAVVAGGPGFVAVGTSGVVAGGPGFVAVGTSGVVGRPAVWVSSDGQAWEEVVDESLATGVDYAYAVLNDVTVGGPGFVAVGCEVPGPGESSGPMAARDDAWSNRHPGIWVSTDGLEWERLPDEAVVGSNAGSVSAEGDGEISGGTPLCIGSVSASEDGLVAIGDRGDRVWQSPDGYKWSITRSSASPDSVADSSGVWNGELIVAALGGGRTVAAGVAPPIGRVQYGQQPPADVSAMFWVVDPETGSWFLTDRSEAITRVGMVNTANMDYSTLGVVDDLVSFGDGFIAVGHDGLDDRTDAAVWIGSWGS